MNSWQLLVVSFKAVDIQLPPQHLFHYIVPYTEEDWYCIHRPRWAITGDGMRYFLFRDPSGAGSETGNFYLTTQRQVEKVRDELQIAPLAVRLVLKPNFEVISKRSILLKINWYGANYFISIGAAIRVYFKNDWKS